MYMRRREVSARRVGRAGEWARKACAGAGVWEGGTGRTRTFAHPFVVRWHAAVSV